MATSEETKQISLSVSDDIENLKSQLEYDEFEFLFYDKLELTFNFQNKKFFPIETLVILSAYIHYLKTCWPQSKTLKIRDFDFSAKGYAARMDFLKSVNINLVKEQNTKRPSRLLLEIKNFNFVLI